jgi:hypothetical protein
MKKTLLLLVTCLCSLQVFAQAKPEEGVQQVNVGAEASEVPDKEFDVFPNPSQGVIHVSLSGFENKKTEVRITNVIGNLVYRDILQELDNRFVKAIDLSRFPKGVYYIKLQADEYSEIRKVVIK